MLLNNLAAAAKKGSSAINAVHSDECQATMIINLAATTDHLYIHNNVSEKLSKGNKFRQWSSHASSKINLQT